MFFDLVEDQANFIWCESWFPICRNLVEAALLRGVCLTPEVSEILLGMELVRSRFVSILSFWRVRPCAKGEATHQTRGWRGSNDDETQRRLQMNHKIAVGGSVNYPLKKSTRESMISSLYFFL